jgi:hypothetical protein
MTKILSSIQNEDSASTVADFFQAATIALAGVVAFLTVASTF